VANVEFLRQAHGLATHFWPDFAIEVERFWLATW